MNDIEAQVQLTWIQADAKYQQALTNVHVLLETGRWGALNSADQAFAELQWQDNALCGESAARLDAALDDRAFTLAEASQMAQRQATLRAARLAQAADLQAVSGKVFVATFIDKLYTYAVDKVNETLDMVQYALEAVGIVASFVPGAGWIVSAAAFGTNAAIYAARGKYEEAALSAVAMAPVGRVFGKAKSLASLPLRPAVQGLKQGKIVKVVLGSAARKKACPILRKISFPRSCHAGETTPKVARFTDSITHEHHTIPKEIQKKLPPNLQKDRDIIGRRGLPNRKKSRS
jgi:hypothetical protein